VIVCPGAGKPSYATRIQGVLKMLSRFSHQMAPPSLNHDRLLILQNSLFIHTTSGRSALSINAVFLHDAEKMCA